MRFVSYLSSRPMAMEPAAYRSLVMLASALDKMPTHEVPENAFGASGGSDKPYEIEGGTAIIPIRGPIFHDEDYIARVIAFFSGGCIQSDIAEMFRAASADESVTSIVARIDSPGGHAFGCDTLSEQIYNMRGGKPIIAHVDGMNCSAAYYLSSAADSVWATKDSMHGSIGTALEWYNLDKMLAEMGVEFVQFVSDISPDKRADEMTEEGAKLYQETVDKLGAGFVNAVARNRGVPAKTVTESFGKGWTKISPDAKAAGMIDGIGSFETVLQKLANNPKSFLGAGNKSGKAASTAKGVGMSLKDKIMALFDGEDSGEETAAPAPVAVVTPPAQATAPQQPATVAGMTEAEIVAMKARDEESRNALAQARQGNATAFAAQYATRYLENGSDGNESDRAKATAALESLHLKAAAGEPISTADLSALMEVPVAASILPSGTLSEEELDGATAHRTAGPTDEPKAAADKAVGAVRSNYSHVAAIGK